MEQKKDMEVVEVEESLAVGNMNVVVNESGRSSEGENQKGRRGSS